ncbi:hypothetical protein PHLH7_08240 [Pseudomonas sp. Ost2]|uniref:cupin domain-containing protein n=1 Tax=Pseudomonas sp. Ost2 TaxID=2678260 RepID=UPI001BB3D8F6|nr:cupin domain-containing protein [Pseudomonas sp. Ost2]BBP74720.1 hypothetical protein PHLH7_08240 [Pseudomonas sp. Ost2]
MSAINRDLKLSYLSRQLASPDTQRKTANWDVWCCADSIYNHHYDREVSFLVQAGAAVIQLSTGESVDVAPGDFVTIQPGVSGQWHISAPLENRFCYHDGFDIANRRQPTSLPEGQSHGE